MRSLNILFLLILSACAHAVPVTETEDDTGLLPSGLPDLGEELEGNFCEFFPEICSGGDTDIYADDTDVADTDTEEIEDTDVAPCGVSVKWNVATPVVTPTTFTMPRLEISSNCETPIGVDGVTLRFAGGTWIDELPDGRLGVGNGSIAHLGVHTPYSKVCDDTGCEVIWSINLDKYDLVLTPDQGVDMGFGLATFAAWPEKIALIEELWDATDDTVNLRADVVYHAEHAAGGVMADRTTITITPK